MELPELSEADKQALRDRVNNLEDIDPETIRRVNEKFRIAYLKARRVAAGTLDPMTA